MTQSKQTKQIAMAPAEHYLLRCAHQDRWQTGCLLILLVPVVIILAKLVNLVGIYKVFDNWGGMSMLIACYLYCRWRDLSRLFESCELTIIAIALIRILSVLILIAARSPFPLVDNQLNSLDASILFSTCWIVHFVARLPLTRTCLDAIYACLPICVTAATVLPPFWGQGKASRRFLIEVFLAAIITSVIFALCPAIGPWSVQGYAPSQDQASVTSYLLQLKSVSPVSIDLGRAGVVSFPSFHVVLAILSAQTLGSIRAWRIPVWVFATLTVISTITTGWHYIVDIVGGLAVALFSMVIVDRIILFEPASSALSHLSTPIE